MISRFCCVASALLLSAGAHGYGEEPLYWRLEGNVGKYCDSAENSRSSSNSSSPSSPLTQPSAACQPAYSAEVPKLPARADSAANKSSLSFLASSRTSLAAASAELADFKAGQAFTIECWIRPSAYPDQDNVGATVFHKRSHLSTEPSSPAPGYQLHLQADGLLSFRADAGAEGARALVSKTHIPLNEWTHVAVTRDTAGKINLYVNGAAEGQSRGALPASLSNNGCLTIGANRFISNKSFHWSGEIDELRISSEALSPEQLLAAAQ